jgi:hypothetical protein
MAAGQAFFQCGLNGGISLEQAIRTMVKDDGTGNPVISLNPDSTLEPWYQCQNLNISLEQLAAQLIVEDGTGKPAWNITNL